MPKKRSVKRHLVTQPSDPSYRLIPLTRNQNAIVDAADFEWLSRWNWYAVWSPGVHGFYASRGARRGARRWTLGMHRVILGCKKREEEVDHWNHDTLDNRRQNLRKCTHSQNSQNIRKSLKTISGYKGETWSKTNQGWHAKIIFNGRTNNLGFFRSKEAAAFAYDLAAKKLFGEFA